MRGSFLFASLIALCYSCKNKEKICNMYNTKASADSSSIFRIKRDNPFIIYTVKEFVRNDCIEYDYYNDDNKNDTRLFSIIIIEKKRDNRILYDAKSLIGFRDSINKVWKIYTTNVYSADSYSRYIGASIILRSSYFCDLVGRSDEFGYKHNYNVIDKDFFDKDLYFQKGKDVDSLFYFQTQNDLEPGNQKRKKIIPFLQIDYPEEILKLYK